MSCPLRPTLPVILSTTLVGSVLAQNNLLILIADDVGVDRIGAYAEHPDPGRTPNIDRLAAGGVLFRNCWGNPICSPTRASILTGRYSFRTGIGVIVDKNMERPGLLLDEWTLPEVLDVRTAGAYRTACLGKWHLRGEIQPITHPNDSGFEHYAGSLCNLHGGGLGAGGDYFEWDKVIDGQTSVSKTYATSDTVNDALRVIAGYGDEPWLVWVAFNAAHTPYHAPPQELHDFRLSGDPDDSPALHHKAMVQAMDTEIGRLLGGIDPAVLARTTIVFVADNGTQKEATEPPFPPGHAKGTLFEGGVNVPLIVAGPGVSVPGSECQALVNTTDLFATLSELAGVDARAVVPPRIALDGVSLVPLLADPSQPSLRDVAFAERFAPNHPRPDYVQRQLALRGERFKLMWNPTSGKQRLFDLASDRFEEFDLLKEPLTHEMRVAWLDLRRRLATLLADDGG